jgi:hypothetical protein
MNTLEQLGFQELAWKRFRDDSEMSEHIQSLEMRAPYLVTMVEEVFKAGVRAGLTKVSSEEAPTTGGSKFKVLKD